MRVNIKYLIYGRVKSLKRKVNVGIKHNDKRTVYERILKGAISRKNYQKVCFHKNLKKYNYLVSRLVLIAFRGFPPQNNVCRHLDGNPSNNNLDNLCWGTAKENARDKFLHGRTPFGERNGNSKLKNCETILLKKLLKNNIPIVLIAKIFKLHWGHVYKIKRGSILNAIN